MSIELEIFLKNAGTFIGFTKIHADAFRLSATLIDIQSHIERSK